MPEIVHRITTTKQSDWQKALKNCISQPSILLQNLNLDESYLEQAQKAARLFPLRVTEHFLSLIEKGNINDPLLRQILPLGSELMPASGYLSDPLQENKYNPVAGLLHKYKTRVLITVTQACAIHCRYCFRREFDYSNNNPGKKRWGQILDYIKANPMINEVIYSGGDPLSASDEYLMALTEQLSTLKQLRRLRIHTRMPILIPSRVNDAMLNWLCKYPQLKPIVVLHANHPNELSQELQLSLRRLKSNGVTLLNQSVLLKGINDKAETLIELSERLFAYGVQPYYLHLLDPVKGAHHFEVTERVALEIMREVKQMLPGFLVPKLVREEAGALSKLQKG